MADETIDPEEGTEKKHKIVGPQKLEPQLSGQNLEVFAAITPLVLNQVVVIGPEELQCGGCYKEQSARAQAVDYLPKS